MVGERDIILLGEWSMDVADVTIVGAKVKWQWVVCVSFYAPEKKICAWMGGGAQGDSGEHFPLYQRRWEIHGIEKQGRELI